MKIALFSNNLSTEYHKRIGVKNLGDSIVSLAIDIVLDIAGVDKTGIVEIPFTGNHDVSEEYLLPVCGHFGRQYTLDFMRHPKLHPIFLGFGLQDEFLTENEIKYLRKYNPILCRDEFTKNVLRKYDIEAYLFGCLTLLFPEREGDHLDKIFFVDVKDRYKDLLPEDILKKAVFTTHKIAYTTVKKKGGDNESNYARNRLRQYAEEASIVVTSKLHCMCPCIAMGIPTIALGENFSYRYGFIDAFVDAYNKDTIESIEWHNVAANNVLKNTVKPLMADIVKSVFNGTPNIKTIKQLDVFYSNRPRWEYFREIGRLVRHFFGNGRKEYIIWGASAGGYALYAYLSRTISNAKLVGVVDTYAEGEFAGLKIKKPGEWLNIEPYTNTKIIISTLSGHESAQTYLEHIGKKEDDDFIFLHESM